MNKNLSRTTTHFLPAVLALITLLSACESKVDDNPSSLPLVGAAPKIVQLTPKNQALVAQWTKVSSAQGVTPKYEVYYSTSATPPGQLFEIVIPNASQLVTSTIEPLENDRTYYVWVKSIFEGLGASDFSPTASGVPVPPPGTPGAITVNPGEAMLDLKWAEVPYAVKYNVFYDQGSSAATVPPEAAARTALSVLASSAFIGNGIGDPRAVWPAVSAPGTVIDNLTNGATYTVWVQAENTAGTSGYSRSFGTPSLARTAPMNAPVIKSITPGNKKLTLVWDQVPGVPRYKLFYSTSNNSGGATPFPNPIPADSPTVTAELTGLTGLTNGTTYYVWVKSSNSVGDSSFSEGKSGAPVASNPIDWNNAQFELGQATAEYPFAQDLAPSRFFPEGRPNTDRLTRVQETALANLFTDAAAWYVRQLGKTIDFVFLNGGYIDNVLPQGTITVGGLTGIVAPDNRADKIVLLSLTGAQLKEFFGVTTSDTPVPDSVASVAHSGRGGPPDTKYFGIVSQEIRYTLEYPKAPSGTQPELSGDELDRYQHGRIKAGTLKFKGADIVDTQVYRICTTDYNASGEYFTLLNTAGTSKEVIETPFYRGVAEYIYDKQTITPKLDARIKIEGGVVLPPPWVNSNWIPAGN